MANFFEELEGDMKQEVLAAMEGNQEDEEYLTNIAMAALKVVDRINFTEVTKNNLESDKYRELGNRAYKSGYHQRALTQYNKALAYATKGSLSLKLGYSNRSAVLFTAEMFEACERDCSTALGINCPTPKHVVDKLRRRKYQSLSELRKEDQLAPQKIKIRKGAEEFYRLKSRHPDIPCASADVDIVMTSGMPKVVAKRDITAGTLVALEKAFVSWAPETDHYFSCYHCRKLDLNLFPCSGCVTAMFCSKQCEQTALAEYHAFECQFVGNSQIDHEDKWLFKAMLKLKNMCASWEDLIVLSQDLGPKRMKKDSINEMFDSANAASLLSFNNGRHFFHGAVYRRSFVCALFLSCLERMPGFFPKEELGREAAMKALARVMMHFSLYTRATALFLIIEVIDRSRVGAHTRAHRGVFPFAGKLRHCCKPNLHKVAVNDTLALFALKKIKAGTELTVSHAVHWLENPLTKEERKANMLLECHTVCTCFVCDATPEEMLERKMVKIPEDLFFTVLKTLEVEYGLVYGTPVQQCYADLYRVVSSLHFVPFSEEYDLVYKRLRCLHAYVLNKKLNNMLLSEDI